MSGFGIIYNKSSNRKLYEGYFTNKMYSGFGILNNERQIYSGEFKDGKKQGRGRLEDSHHNYVYEGDFNEDFI